MTRSVGLPVVVLVGRPNVGKSSLFNRILGSKRAIVDDEPGVTRDRLVALAEHEGRAFVCVDTGGVDAEPARTSSLLAAVRRQALAAAAEADLVILVLDGRTGLSPADVALARLLTRTGRTLLAAVNKIDGPMHEDRVFEFHRLGIEPVVATSAAHRRGVGHLLDEIVGRLPPTEAAPTPIQGTRLALMGRPNVGKSSLLNRLLGVERVLVAPEAGTTRDTIDTPVVIRGRPYVLIDTAGIRRRGRVRDRLEGHGAVRALGMLTRADIVAVVLDAREGVTDQDARLIGRALELGRGVLLVPNKWDLLEARARSLRAWVHTVERQHPGLAALPVAPVSALTGEGIERLLARIRTLERAYERRLQTATLNRVLRAAVTAHPPPSPGGRAIRVLYGTQTGVRPPTVTVFASAAGRLPTAYVRYLTNVVRDHFDLSGVPVRIEVRSRREPARHVTPRSKTDSGPQARRSARPTRRSRRDRSR